MMRYLTAMDDCGSGLSRESSREDINSECEQQFDYEQRFRVDRKKLEIMMTNSPEFGEAAAEFFERIGIETETTVIWPSRLKIGAKSKKDPHIRVGGRTEEGVTRAKMMITEVLDTSTNSRVTMKMDVSYTDHSHIIGKGGNTIRRVMAETNCHIHFPDSNRSNPNEKSNQVRGTLIIMIMIIMVIMKMITMMMMIFKGFHCWRDDWCGESPSPS